MLALITAVLTPIEAQHPGCVAPTVDIGTVGPNMQPGHVGQLRRPTRGKLLALLYNHESPYTLFKNPRQLAFVGDLRWSHIGRSKADAEMLVAMSHAKFIVEVGCYVGTSTKMWASLLQSRWQGLAAAEPVVLCIDAWLGDLASWVNRVDVNSRSVPDDVIADGRSTLYDQFMLNMLTVERGFNHTVVPFSTTSSIGARWLWYYGFSADLIYLDTAHEVGETAVELALFWKVVRPGGVLAGDDYGWPGVRNDLDHFVQENRLELRFCAPDRLTWYIVKPLSSSM